MINKNNNFIPGRYYIFILLLFPLLTLTSCPPIIDSDIVTLAQDGMAPEITLNPPEGRTYRSSVSFSGSVVDYVDTDGIETGGVKDSSLTWEILNKSAEKYHGTYTIDENNSFFN